MKGDDADTDAEQAPVTNKAFDEFDVLAHLCSTEPYNGPMFMTLCKSSSEPLKFQALGTITYNKGTLI